MTEAFSTLPDARFVGLAPWCWLTFASSTPTHPFELIAGIHGDVSAALNDVRALLRSELEALIGDVSAGRIRYDDPRLAPLLEDAYAEILATRPHLAAHVAAHRDAGGRFHWSYRKDPHYRSPRALDRIGFFHGRSRDMRQGELQALDSRAVGWLVGLLDGSRSAGELRRLIAARGPGPQSAMTRMLDNMARMDMLVDSARSSVQEHWLRHTQDGDLIHLGHAALMLRAGDEFFLFDPYLMPWTAHADLPSPWASTLPRPSGIFFTHEHDDHLDERALMAFPKDTPIIVPKARAGGLFFDYRTFLTRLGFTDIRELGHGEGFAIPGGAVLAIPFHGEDPCDLRLDRNCYLVAQPGRNVLVWADSGPANDGSSPLTEGVVDDLVAKLGKVDLILCSQQQLMELRALSVYCAFSPPGGWLTPGENGFLDDAYLAEVCRRSGARQFISYATGGADWLPDTHNFIFHGRNRARSALVRAAWKPLESLAPLLEAMGCGWHWAQATDIYRARPDGGTDIIPTSKKLDAAFIFGLDH